MENYKVVYTYNNEAEQTVDVSAEEAENIRKNGFGENWWSYSHIMMFEFSLLSEEELSEVASGNAEISNCVENLSLLDETGTIYSETKSAKELAQEEIKKFAIKKDYRTYPLVDIGCSEISTFIVAGKRPYGEDGAWVKTFALSFPSDGDYFKAYVVREWAVIPESFKLVGTVRDWCRIYDDDKLSFSANGEEISIYRNGLTCIIQVR